MASSPESATARPPFFVIEPDRKGTWWQAVQGEHKILGRVRASGRRKALALVQEQYGGETHGSGGFYDVLIGSQLGEPVRMLRSLDERVLEVRR